MKSFNTILIPSSKPDTASAAKSKGVTRSAVAPADCEFNRSEAEESGGGADGGNAGT